MTDMANDPISVETENIAAAADAEVVEAPVPEKKVKAKTARKPAKKKEEPLPAIPEDSPEVQAKPDKAEPAEEAKEAEEAGFADAVEEVPDAEALELIGLDEKEPELDDAIAAAAVELANNQEKPEKAVEEIGLDNFDDERPAVEVKKPAKRAASKKKADAENVEVPVVQNGKKKNVKMESAVKTFKRSQETIIGIDGEEKESEEVEIFRQNIIDLAQSQKAGKALKANVSTVISIKGFGLCAVLYYGMFKVLIPFNAFLKDELKKYPNGSDMTQLQKEKYLLDSYLEAETEFIVKAIDADNKIALGDHIEACNAMQRKFFFPNKRYSEPIVKEGALVEAKVMAVRRGGAILNIFGFEKFVETKHLTYNQVDNARSLFSAGDVVQLRIVSIEYELNGSGNPEKVKDIAVVGREKNIDMLKAAVDRLVGDEGGHPTTFGEVSNIDETGGVYVLVNVAGYKVTVRCPVSRMAINIGWRVTVRISGVKKDGARPLVFGIITQAIPPVEKA